MIERDAGAAAERRDGDWFDRASRSRRTDAEAALDAYERAIAADPTHLDARINLGPAAARAGALRRGRAGLPRRDQGAAATIRCCSTTSACCSTTWTASREAIAAYEAALRGDPDLADCHYNLALLYEKLEKPKEAIRHMAQYRRLVGRRPK